MVSNVYPVKHPEGQLTKEQIHLLLSRPALIAKRLADITQMRFIADYLLQGRFDAAGGGIYYETGEEIFAADSPEAVAPNGEYPKTVLTEGDIAAAKTVKWGLESDITDEKIARQGITVVNRTLTRLGNTVIRHVDRVSMAVIASKVTSSFTVPTFDTAGKLIRGLESIRGQRADLGLGIDLSTVVLKPDQYAQIIGMLVDDKALPREQGNLIISGNLPIDALGYTWATTPHYTGADPMLIDREQLGGMADEDLGSPGYVRAGGFGVESLTERGKRDNYEVRGRRVTVPVVTEPLAGVRLNGSGL